MNIIEIRLTIDYAFKRVFGHKDNKKILIALLNHTMMLPKDREITEVDLKNPFSTKDFDAEKQNILDIKAVDNFGKHYDVEMQTVVFSSYTKRLLHYACNLYTDQLKAGDSFLKLNPVISISFIDGVLFDDVPEYAHRFMLRDEHSTIILTEDMVFIIFELGKFTKSFDELSGPLDEWLYLIKHIHEIDFDNPPKFKYIPIKEILEVISHMKKSTIEREQYRDRLRAQRDLLTMREESYNKGRQEGRLEGRLEGRQEGRLEGRQEGEQIGIKKGVKEAAKKMRKEGLDINIIAKITGLSEEEIEALK